MDFLVKLSMALSLFVLTWLSQEQNQEWVIQRNLLKSAANFAAHDAVQQWDRARLGEGVLEIDEQVVYAVFLETLQHNLGLNEELEPLPGSRMRQPVTVVYFEVVDTRTVSFPYLYAYPDRGIAKYLRGPAVIVVIETPHPQWVRFEAAIPPIRVPAIQEYAFSS